jgi:hypothetical protein
MLLTCYLLSSFAGFYRFYMFGFYIPNTFLGGTGSLLFMPCKVFDLAMPPATVMLAGLILYFLISNRDFFNSLFSTSISN